MDELAHYKRMFVSEGWKQYLETVDESIERTERIILDSDITINDIYFNKGILKTLKQIKSFQTVVTQDDT